ncbi:MAG: PCMD domain-containing protein [Bacteroidales bacterium]|nr:PCMD domain-containing protein [Bacteroidales bacterium]
MNFKRVLISVIIGLECFVALGQQQLPNSGFDLWTRKNGCWNPYSSNGENITWDTANHGLSIIGINGASPEYQHVAVPGKGKAAVKVETRQVFGILVAGTIYTGRFLGLVRLSGAKIQMGVPFTGRPRSLSGYVHYIPGQIDVTSRKTRHLKGAMDNATLDISLRDGKELQVIDTTEESFQEESAETYPDLVGYGVMYVKEDTKGYIRFEIPIEYKNDHTPTNIVISVSSSRYAQQFTGSTDSILYVDELQLNY